MLQNMCGVSVIGDEQILLRTCQEEGEDSERNKVASLEVERPQDKRFFP
jgi:predicted secreted protein